MLIIEPMSYKYAKKYNQYVRTLRVYVIRHMCIHDYIRLDG